MAVLFVTAGLPFPAAQGQEVMNGGRDGTNMPAFEELLSADELRQVHAFLMSRDALQGWLAARIFAGTNLQDFTLSRESTERRRQKSVSSAQA